MRPLWIGSIGAKDNFAHDGMNAVRADHSVRLRARSVGKRERDLSCALFQSHQFLVEMDDFLRHHRGEGIVQVGAVHAQIGRAEEALRHGQFSHHLAGVPFAVQVRIRLEGSCAELFPPRRCGAGPSSSSASSECPRRSAQSAAPAHRRARRCRFAAAWPRRPFRRFRLRR